MAAKKRIKTKYPGVFYRVVKSRSRPGKNEKVYFIYARIKGTLCEERAGKEFEDQMTPARAAVYLGERIEGKRKSPKELREEAAAAAKKKRWTIDRLWQEYASDSRADHSRYEKHLKNKFGNTEPAKLVQIDVERLKSDLSRKLKPQSVKHVMALLRRLINFGVNKGYCSGPVFKIPIPQRINNIKTEDLTDRQLKRLIKAIDESSNQQVANMMRLVLCTGMRRGELFKLRWHDVDFDRGFIHIKAPKGGVDQKIPLNIQARKILEGKLRDSEFVFSGRNGKMRTDMNYQARKIVDAAGLPKDFRPFHGLRHFFASHLASSGKVDMFTLQKLLTHKSPQMTQRYAHLRDDVLQRASAVAGNILNVPSDEQIVAIPVKKGGKLL